MLENYNLLHFDEELQTMKLPDPRFYIKRSLKESDFNRMAEGTNFIVLSDPVVSVPDKRHLVLCQCSICGKRSHIRFITLRDKTANCQNCFKLKLEKEAENVGMTLIGTASQPAYRTYKFNVCGHIKECRTDDVRKNNCFCRECFYEKVVESCKEYNFTPDVTRESVSYKFKATCNLCGKVSNKSLKQIGKCLNCIKLRIKESATSVGAEYIKYEKPNHSLFRFKCGHEQVVDNKKFASGKYLCRVCKQDEYKSNAENCGVEIDLTQREDVSGRYMCRLPCGCSQYVRMDALTRGRVYCEICENRSHSLPTKIYFLKIESRGFTFLKLGVSLDVEQRIQQYRLALRDTVTVLATFDYPTWFSATKKEKTVHKKFRDKRIDPLLMKNYMKSGFTECYPESCEEIILSEINKRKI